MTCDKDSRYRTTQKYKDTIARYRSTEKFKETRRRYSKTKKYWEIHQRFHLKRKYEITLEDYNVLIAKQNNLCAICNKSSGKKSLAVDHNHKTGKVRGLLCYKCNVALGYLSEDIERMNKMIAYVQLYM